MICRADEHYRVHRSERSQWSVYRHEVSGENAPGWNGGQSGTPRYNRMRAKMVRHIHAEHAKASKP